MKADFQSGRQRSDTKSPRRKLASSVGLILIGALLFALTACQMFRGPDDGGPKKFLLPWPDAKGEYHLQIVEINTLEDLTRMEGKYGKVRYNQSSDRVSPEGQFTQLENGVYVPDNVNSQQMVGIYGHIEKLSELENRLGLEGILPRPRFMSIETNIVDDKGTRQMDNATYFGQIDTVAIVPNTSRTLPISLNGGIVAHEHFHALFYHLVIKQLGEDVAAIHRNIFDDFKDNDNSHAVQMQDAPIVDESRRDKKFFASIIIAGLNEGLADYWAWNYTSDGSFLEKSLTYRKLSKRRVEANGDGLPGRDPFHRSHKDSLEQFASGASYSLGTRYASFMRTLAQIDGKDHVAKLMVEGLRILANKWPEVSSKGQISPNTWLKALLQVENPSKGLCCTSLRYLSQDYDDHQSIIQTCQGISCSGN